MFDLQHMTMNPEEATSVSQAIFELLITGGELADTHDIVTGIEHKTQIPFIGNLGLVGKKVTACSRGINPNTIPLTEKFWDPVLIGDRLKHCATDVNQLFKLFQKAKRINPDYFNNIDTEAFGVIIAKVSQALQAMLNRKVWFEDTAAANVSGGGLITNGTDVSYFNTFDGLFKQIFAEVPTTAKNYVEIASNSGVSYVAQALPANAALAIFREMHNKMDARMLEAINQGATPVLLVTRELAQNYWDTLEDKSLNFTLKETQDGISRLMYRGIEIREKHDWDINIRAYEDSGTAWNLPNRAVLTVKENIPVGTLSVDDLAALRSWFDNMTLANYIDFDLSLDAKFLLDYMAVVAY